MDYIVNMKQLYLDSNGQKGANILVTNLSSGVDYRFPEDSPDWCKFYDDAGELGILSVSAATNTDTNVELGGDLPSTCPSEYLVTVTNTDNNDLKVRSSGFSDIYIDLGAPGEDVFSTQPGNTYGFIRGTSASSPHVAGAVALLYNAHCEKLEKLLKDSPSEAVLLMKEFILAGVDPLNSLTQSVSGGRLNVFKSLIALSNYCSETANEDLDIKKVYSNSEYVNVEYTTQIFSEHQFKLYDAIGQLIYESSFTPELFGSKLLQLEISDLQNQPGYFLASISNLEGVVTKKFFIFN